MTTAGLIALIAISMVTGYILNLLWLHRATWKSFSASFGIAYRLPPRARPAGKPCALAINGTVLSEISSTQRFNLIRPFVLIQPEGIVFYLRPDVFRIFAPVLVRFDQIRAFGRVRHRHDQWFEVEFKGDTLSGWAHLPASLRDRLCTLGAEFGTSSLMIVLAAAHASPPRTISGGMANHVTNYTPWVVESDESLQDRDPLDSYNDVSALWTAAYENLCQNTWSHASALYADMSTSYWLRAALKDCMDVKKPVTFGEVNLLLKLCRARMNEVLGTPEVTWAAQ